jgi:hypothetical protein
MEGFIITTPMPPTANRHAPISWKPSTVCDTLPYSINNILFIL